MFDKVLSSIGIGSATVDTKLSKDVVVQGGFLEGIVVVQGGKVPQKVEDIYLKLMTYVMEKHNDKEVRVSKEICRFHLNDPFMIGAGESYHRPFRFRIPFSTPISLNKSVVWVQTGLDIQKAINPQDKDRLKIMPLPYVAELIGAFEELGFSCREAESKKALTFFPSDSGIIQEMEFVAHTGELRGKFDEVEVWLSPKSQGLVDVMFQVDKRVRGFRSALQEAVGLDEKMIRLSITQQNVSRLSFILNDMLRKA